MSLSEEHPPSSCPPRRSSPPRCRPRRSTPGASACLPACPPAPPASPPPPGPHRRRPRCRSSHPQARRAGPAESGSRAWRRPPSILLLKTIARPSHSTLHAMSTNGAYSGHPGPGIGVTGVHTSHIHRTGARAHASPDPQYTASSLGHSSCMQQSLRNRHSVRKPTAPRLRDLRQARPLRPHTKC